MSEERDKPTGCPFRPPAPTPAEKRGSTLLGLLKAQRDLLHVLPEITYRTRMGRLPLGLRDLFFVSGPERVRDILTLDADNYPKSRQMYRALQPLAGDGIFISNGDTWRRRRKMVDPAFANVRLRVAFPMMQTAVDDMLARLSALPADTVVNLDAEMAHVTADIIFRAIFSRPLTQQVSRDVFEAFSQYQESLPQFDLMEIVGMPDWVPRRSLRKARRAGGRIRAILRGMIEQRLDSIDHGREQDILDVLIHSTDPAGRRFKLEELVDEVAVLFLAGHETSATALTWAVYLSSQQPEVERRLVEEAERILDHAPRFEDINRLTFTRNVFKEALRLYPPVSFITREARQERRIGRWHIRRNSMMVVSPWVIHRHRGYWQQPDCFMPHRYDLPETKESERQAYLPFGAGQRACPGASFAMLEGPLILASLFRRFQVSLQPGVVVEPVCRLTTRPKNKILVRLHNRESNAGRQVDAGNTAPYSAG